MEKSILEMVGGERHIKPHYNIKAESTRLKEEQDKRIVELEKENAELRTKVTALENANRAMAKELDGMASGGLNALKNVARSKEQLEYSKAIIKSLLDNSDEHARQRAMDFLEAKE